MNVTFEEVPIYYVLRAGEEKEKGPYSLKDLRNLWTAGKVDGTVLYATEGMEQWKPLTKMWDQLFGAPPKKVETENGLIKCADCGKEISKRAAACPHCGGPVTPPTVMGTLALPRTAAGTKERWVYIVLGLLLGGIGIHNFYAGRTGVGLVQVAIALTLGWMVFPLLAVMAWSLWEVFTVDTDGRGLVMR